MTGATVRTVDTVETVRLLVYDTLMTLSLRQASIRCHATPMTGTTVKTVDTVEIVRLLVYDKLWSVFTLRL